MRRLEKEEEKPDKMYWLPVGSLFCMWYNVDNKLISMLQKENRLAKVRDFNLVMEHGSWVNGRFLDMKVLELAKNQDYFPKKEDVDKFKTQLRIAISVGLKVSKSAVKRNRVKRQVGEVLRLLIKDGLIKGGHYVLVIAKKDILDKDYAEISQEMKLLLSRTKLLLC